MLIAGFVVGGAGTGGNKSVLLRGIGPALMPLGVSEALEDPVLTLFRGTSAIALNENWGGEAASGTRGARALFEISIQALTLGPRL